MSLGRGYERGCKIQIDTQEMFDVMANKNKGMSTRKDLL